MGKKALSFDSKMDELLITCRLSFSEYFQNDLLDSA